MKAHVQVNGIDHEVSLEVDRSLLSFLREELDLTGTKLGCGEGECSACAVLVGSRECRSCVTPLAEVADQHVTTIEGLAEDGYLHPVQQAFLEQGAMQCGYCTTGWIIGTAALLNRNPSPTDGQIETELAGHVCRCCTYPRILKAVHRAAELMKDSELFEDTSPTQSALGDHWDAKRIPWDLAGEEQDFFGALGDGLVIVFPDGQDLGRAELGAKPSRRVGGAWLHVSPDATVTAFTGKVEIGQGTRTALEMLVGEELRIPASAVVMVMGDTALSPYDAGTSGSRSMIEIGECLRAAGWVARETLLKLAGVRLGRKPEELTISLGKVIAPADEVGISWHDLLKGQQRIEIVPVHSPTTAPAVWSLAGKPLPASRAPDIVTGRKRYPYDQVRRNMMHGKVLRAPALGATLRTVTMPSDGNGITFVHEGQFVGVIAPTSALAADALAQVQAEWDFAPQQSENGLDDYLRAHPLTSGMPNSAFRRDTGDVDQALAEATTRLSATYTAAYLAHVPLEPRSALAEWEDDHLTVVMGTQRPFPVRKSLASYFELPEAHVRVIVPDFGSGFGGKHFADVGIEAGRLARVAGCPVKLQWTRAEEFTWAYFRPAAVIDVDAAMDPDGQITGWAFLNINSGPAGIKTPYRIEHQRIEHQPAASPLAHGSYRALAATANNFARESHMDDLAHLAGIDPIAFRLRHTSDERLIGVLNAVAHRVEWPNFEERPGVGVGIAATYEKLGYVATFAEVQVDAVNELKLVRLVTAFDCGAIVNPDNLNNQVEGAMAQAIGGALFERIHFAEGKILNGSMAEYRVPRMADIPPFEVILIDRPDEPPVGGSETPFVCVAPAIGNAIFDATGVRLRSLPLAPDGIVPTAR